MGSVVLFAEMCCITPWNGVLLEKLIVSELVKNFTTFYETVRFIVAFTRPLNLSLL
jgi:hypothetical protein